MALGRVRCCARRFQSTAATGSRPPCHNSIDRLDSSEQVRTIGNDLHQKLPYSSANYQRSTSSAPSKANSSTSHQIDIRPWMVEFTPPKQAPSVRIGNFLEPRTPTTQREKSMLQERKTDQHLRQLDKLANARQRSIDYMLKRASSLTHRNPTSMKGWSSLVEERIEDARKQGRFLGLHGRGKPLAKNSLQHNPFISREDFFMNRIIQRNGAIPQWIELQMELDNSIRSFRIMLRSDWIRHAVRMSTSLHVTRLVDSSLEGFMSPSYLEWEIRERAYHQEAIRQINSLTRRYNNIAPYAVRRPYLDREVELQAVYQSSKEEILKRTVSGESRTMPVSKEPKCSLSDSSRTHGGLEPARFRDILIGWWRSLRRR